MQEILRDPSLIHADAASSGSATYVAGQSLCVKHLSFWPQPAAGERFVGLSLARALEDAGDLGQQIGADDGGSASADPADAGDTAS